MEKNLAENSGSFAGRDEQNNAGDNPMPEPTDVDAKTEGETTEKEPIHEGDHPDHEEKKEEAGEVPPESPPPNLQKVSEEIDQWLVTLQKNDNVDHVDDASLEIPNFVDKFLDLVEERMEKYDAGEGKAKWGEVAEEDSTLLETVGRISLLMKLLSHQEESPSGEEINERKDSLVNRIGLIQQRAMSYLEEDFRVLMEESRIQPEDPSPGGNHDPKGKHVAEQDQPESQPHESHSDNFPGYPEETIANLNKIAKEMISGGYQSECCQVYTISRRIAFEECLQKQGFEKISIDEIQKMQWESLEREIIPAWINTFKECTSVYFVGERKLAESVFAGHPGIAASLFSNLSRGVVIQLLNFAEGAAMAKRAGEKLFKLLDMYETLRDVIPALDNLFPEECMEELKTEMTVAKNRLGEAAICIFCDLENQIKSEPGKTAVPGGAVHPLTRYIMNYLSIAGDYKDTLEQVFKEHSKIERADSTSRPHHEVEGNSRNDASGGSDNEHLSPFAAQLTRVMELLDSSLDGKARLYKDVALSNFFMMNNGRYILQKIKKSSEIYQLMGDTWIRKRSSDLRTFHKNYQRETWNRVVQCLNPEGLNVNGKVHKPVLKERFKSFNALFDDIHKTQSQWVVKDEQLQSELRVSISAVMIPAYRAFLARFSQYLDPGRQTEKYVKYQAEDIETYIDELFDGKPHQYRKKM